jgi:hypothetical protein
MSLYDIKDNNNFQPCRYFALRGEVVLIGKEVNITTIKLSVFNYQDIGGEMDIFTVYFRESAKRAVDKMVVPHVILSVMGDMIMKDGKVFLDGKTVEVFKVAELVTEGKSKFVDPKEANYDRAF